MTARWTPTVGLIVAQAFAGSRRKGGEALRAAADAGARWVSVTEDGFSAPSDRVRELRTDAENAGIPIVMAAVHAFGLNDPRDAVRDFNLTFAKAHVDFARELGAERMKVLLGEWIWRGMWPNAMQWRLAADTLRRLCDYAEQKSITLGIELEPLESSLVNDPRSLARMLADVGSPALLANVDTSHMAVRAAPPSEIRALTGLVDTVDFSDSNGRWHEHLPPGAGEADLAAFARELVRARRSDTMLVAVEVGPFRDPDSAFEKVSESIHATGALFAEAVGLDATGAEPTAEAG